MIYISPSQITTWGCREAYRQSYLLGPSAHPSVYMAFGSCIHRMAFAYWEGWEYEKAFSWAVQPALYNKTEEEWREKFETIHSPYTTVVYPHGLIPRNSYLDQTKLSAKEMDKWNERLDSLAKITSHYYSYHGDEPKNLVKLTANEKLIQFQIGEVACSGFIDRIANGCLVDTKTVSVTNRNKNTWQADTKTENIRKAQLNFYLEWCKRNHIEIEKVIIEAIVRFPDGSVDLKELNITKEVFAQHERFLQQLNWNITEMASYISTVKDAAPWPMNREMCAGKYSECEFVKLCDQKVSNADFVRLAI